MKVLVLGNGGREHALAWRLSKDKSAENVFLHPGNAGTWQQSIATLGDVPLGNREALATAAAGAGVDLVVIGPEALLAQGYADHFRAQGFAVVGPGVEGAQLETSKLFAKDFLVAAGIPTARFNEANTPEQVRDSATRYPIVLKLDGLAAGKGVVVAKNSRDTEDFIDRVWNQKEFGEGPHSVVVEDFIAGRELSYIGLCDGETFLPLSSASDYKRLLDKDEGPNTGGMGAISPSPLMSKEMEARIERKVVAPTLKELAKRKLDYRGALYFGLMIDAAGEPHVLEFNARFGDPETQVLMLRLQGDFAALLKATAHAELSNVARPIWASNVGIYVVAAAEGYPSRPRTGDLIEGIESIGSGATVFFSGVGDGTKGLVTQGGRVLGVGAVADSGEACRKRVYSALSNIRWAGKQFRRDIGE